MRLAGHLGLARGSPTRASPGPSLFLLVRRKRLQPGWTGSLTVMDGPRLPVPAREARRREFRAASGQVASLLKLASPRLFLRVTPRFRPPLGYCQSAFPGLSLREGPGAQGMGSAGLLRCLPILQLKLKLPKETRAPLPLGTCDRAQGSPDSPTGTQSLVRPREVWLPAAVPRPLR